MAVRNDLSKDLFKVSILFTVADTKKAAEEMNQKLGRQARMVDSNKFVGIYTANEKTSIEDCVAKIKKSIENGYVERLYIKNYTVSDELHKLCMKYNIEVV